MFSASPLRDLCVSAVSGAAVFWLFMPLTRRAVLRSFALSCARATEKARVFPSEILRYSDPATEFAILRLTAPAHTSRLPDYGCRAVSRNSGFLLYTSDRTGSLQAFRMDQRTGESEQLTEAAALVPGALSLLADDRGCLYFDGPLLRVVEFPKMRGREIYRIQEPWTAARALSLERDGSHALVVEAGEGRSRIRLAPLRRGSPRTVIELPDLATLALPRPRGDAVLYRHGEALSVCGYDGKPNRTLEVPPGRRGPAFWSPDGQTVLYLEFPAQAAELNSIREVDAAGDADRLLARTSQFVSFAPNRDASVFVGASGSKASPYILLLLRATRRELPVCEHRSSDPARVKPVFSPDSQHVFFESDRDGRPAIYRLDVEKLVAETPG